MLPLIDIQIDTGRVVAAAVQQHKITLTRLLQICHHGIEVEIMGFCLIIAVLFDLKPGGFEDVLVIGPGWVADPNGFAVCVAQNKLGSDPQRAGTSRA